MAHEGAEARKAPAERARTGAVAATGSEEAAQVRRAQGLDVLEAGRGGEMPGEEGEELARVALIGFQRVVGKPALAGKRRKPALPLGHERRIGDDEKFGHVLPPAFARLSHRKFEVSALSFSPRGEVARRVG